MDNLKNKIILAVSAHPDDLEFGCGGTVAQWVKDGAEVYYCLLTDGSKGSEDHLLDAIELKNTRHLEQENAAKVLGVKKVFFLDFVDGELENTAKVRKELVKVIRLVKPNIVITFDPLLTYNPSAGFINHPDHRVAGQATLDAVFPFARNARTFPELIEEGLNPHTVEEVLLFNFSNNNFYVDITKTMDQKCQALACHISQHDDASSAQDWAKNIAMKDGEKIGVKYAEGFLRISINE